ncbi:MAG: tetratricopeptide repeat protein [Treponema sp.]
MSKNISEPVEYIFQSVHTALLTRDFQYAEKLLNHTLKKRKNLTPEELKIAEELRARVYVRANNLEKALESCLGLYNENPDDIETMNTLGVLYRQLYRFDESLAILNKAKEHAPENEGVFYNLGKTYQEMKQYQKAVECFLAALELKPEDVSAYDLLGGLYAQLGDTSKAIDSYRKGLQWDPNHPSLNFQLGRILQTEKRYDEAIFYYKTALKTQPAWKEVLQNLASLYVLQGKLDDALKVYRSLLRISGKNPAICTEIGAVFERKHLPTEAEQYYREALTIDAGYAPAALALVSFLKKNDHRQEILPILLSAQADSKNAKNYPLQFQTVEACIAAREYAKAQHILQNIEPAMADKLTFLKLQGKLAALMGDTDRAEKIFEKIIAVAPSEIAFRYELAEHYVKTGKYNEAKEQLHLFLNGKPDDITARLLLGKTEELLNNPKCAYGIYQKIIQDYPDSIDARAALSRFLHRHGNIVEALQTADEMVCLQSSSTAENDIQGLADSLDLYEKAVENYIADPALTKNLEKLKPESAEFVSSEELARVDYKDELSPLVDESSIVPDTDIPLELFTEEGGSELVDEDDSALDELPSEEEEYTTQDSEDALQSAPAVEVPYQRSTLSDLPQNMRGSEVPPELRSDAALPAETEPLSATVDGQEGDSSTVMADEQRPLSVSEEPDFADMPLSDPLVSTEPAQADAMAAAVEADSVEDTPPIAAAPEHGIAAAPEHDIAAAAAEVKSGLIPESTQTETVGADGQPHAMHLYTTPYNTEMLDAAVKSLNSIVSHLGSGIDAAQKHDIADSIAAQVAGTLLDKVHELSESRYKNADSLSEPAANQTETGIAAPQESSNAVPQETGIAAPQETGNAVPQESSITAPQESSIAAAQETGIAASQETGIAAPQETGNAVPQESSITAPQESSIAAAQETGIAASQETGIAVPQESSNAVPQESSITAPQESSIAAAQETGIAASQETGIAVPQESSNAVPQESSITAPQESSNAAAQETGIAAQQETGNAVPQETGNAAGESSAAHADSPLAQSLSVQNEENLKWWHTPHTVKDVSDFNKYLDTVEGETLAGMLMYIKDLFAFLPTQTLGSFLTSRQRMQIHYIISRLSGELGLKDQAELLRAKNGYVSSKPHSIDYMQIIGLFEYLHDLCVELSDEGLQTGCMYVLDQLLSDFWQATEHEFK